MNKKELSIILPVYNENESLELMVKILTHSLNFDHEIIIVYDSLEDISVPIAKRLENNFSNVRTVHNKISHGVKYAIQSGLSVARFNFILITAVDEIFPIIAIDEMINLILNQGYEFISGTRYSKGGKRIGGSLLGSILSRLANKLFKIFTNFPLSDCTTGIKMMRKNIWNNINLESNPVGWAFAFEITIKAYLNNYKISEVPLKSVDRLFGGKSTFKPISWVKEYSKWFLWGIKKIKKRKPK